MHDEDLAVIRALELLLPDEIVAVGRSDWCDDLALAEERALTHAMIEKRRREFLTGRTCAREALRGLGFPDHPILPAANRAPIWPPGACGSISHTEGFYLAAVGRAEHFFGIGVDVEGRERVTADLESYVASSEEASLLAHIPDWRTILFSVKESIFKCINPPTGIWLEFHDVEILALEEDRFLARVQPRERDPFEVQGRYAVVKSFVLSALVMRDDAALGDASSAQSSSP